MNIDYTINITTIIHLFLLTGGIVAAYRKIEKRQMKTQAEVRFIIAWIKKEFNQDLTVNFNGD